MAFKGHIVYSRTFPEVEKAADELLKFVELKKKDGGRAIIGFDVEWRPSFRKGSYNPIRTQYPSYKSSHTFTYDSFVIES